ncbi:carboxypeptidase B2-like [Diabrotica virgifera virgifera]|uniref:Peptidase M14 domain-containing protein n=1 Tax=Diabrotica virgifera virgifera TaxID=50390 RepID=A0ABM5IX15_DIAVI|nr:carboxypeptidase B2-like [Diabrotica virgifera virgifera]
MAVLVEAGSDGSNILAVASALYLINFLTRNQSFVKIMDYYILPCSNPDAYDRIIKNIDLNGTVPVNLANNFPIILGAKALEGVTTQDFVDALEEWKINLRFSSPVTNAIIKAVALTQKHVKLFISLQEGGSSLVFPFGSSSEVSNDEEELATMAQSVQRVLRNIKIEIGSLYTICGLTFGSVIDFLKYHCGDIKFTYIFHIKDNEQETSIRDVLVYGEDVFNCVKSLARNVYMHYNKLKPNKRRTLQNPIGSHNARVTAAYFPPLL